MTQFDSSTQVIPDAGDVPRHVAIIMDGNGRWAKKRFLPRVAGHRKGVEAVRETVKACAEAGVEYLTLFAFSSENWRRPPEEVSFLMQLFLRALEVEVEKLARQRHPLQGRGRPRAVRRAPARAHHARRDAHARQHAASRSPSPPTTAGAGTSCRPPSAAAASRPARARSPRSASRSYLSMSYAPEPDLFIRTGGEQRVSNFLLWQLAYTELFFTDALWPDFGAATLEEAFASYRTRERRFGRTSEQLEARRDAVPAHRLTALLRTRVVTAVVVLVVLLGMLFFAPASAWSLFMLAVALVALLGMVANERPRRARAIASTSSCRARWARSSGWPISGARRVCSPRRRTRAFLCSAVFWIVVVADVAREARAAFAFRVRARRLARHVAHVVRLRDPAAMPVPGSSLAVAALVWIADIAAYFTGRAFGRRKLAPAISPGKTWEGVYGALAGVAAYGARPASRSRIDALSVSFPPLLVLLASRSRSWAISSSRG